MTRPPAAHPSLLNNEHTHIRCQGATHHASRSWPPSRAPQGRRGDLRRRRRRGTSGQVLATDSGRASIAADSRLQAGNQRPGGTTRPSHSGRLNAPGRVIAAGPGHQARSSRDPAGRPLHQVSCGDRAKGLTTAALQVGMVDGAPRHEAGPARSPWHEAGPATTEQNAAPGRAGRRSATRGTTMDAAPHSCTPRPVTAAPARASARPTAASLPGRQTALTVAGRP